VITPADYEGRVLVMGYECLGFIKDLNARALSLNDGNGRLVIVTYDLNCLDVATPILRSRCLHELGLDPARLILMGTHNHAAPIQITPANFDYGRWLAGRIFDLIKEAMANEQGPARLYFGSGEGRWLMATGGHQVDPEIQVLKVAVGDQVKAVLFNQPTHPMQSSFWRIETGHPGYAMDYVEKKLPGTMAMYADACGGNQFPLVGTVMLTVRPVVKLLGSMVGAKVVSIAKSDLTEVTGAIDSKLEVISLPLAPPLSLDEARALAEKEKVDPTLGFVPYPQPQRECNWIRNLIRHYEQGIPFPTRTDQRVCTAMKRPSWRGSGPWSSWPCRARSARPSAGGSRMSSRVRARSWSSPTWASTTSTSPPAR
jgi:hypothetical protein